ncbi:MAG: helix-turn-helix domain-containing protein [Fimbriimonadaceae bacterium]
MKHALIGLNEPPQHVVAGFEDLAPGREEWVQPASKWQMTLYRHSGIAHVNTATVAYSSGTAVLFPPNCRGAHARVGVGTPIVYFEFSDLRTDRPTTSIPIAIQLSEADIEECAYIAVHIGTDFHQSRAALWRMLWRYSTTSRAATSDETVLRAERYVASRLAEPFSVAEMCRDLGVPQRTLLRLFSAEHGSTICRYIIERRGREAARLLSAGNLSVKAVAARVGVPDLQQFNKLVRSTVGMSPRSVMARALEGPVHDLASPT